MKTLSIQDIFNLQDLAKKNLRDISLPLEGMRRKLTESEELALAWFLASITLLNQLTDERISDKVLIKFSDVDVGSVYEQG